MALSEPSEIEQDHSLFCVRMTFSLRVVLLHLSQCEGCRKKLGHCSVCGADKLLSMSDICDLCKTDKIGVCESCGK